VHAADRSTCRRCLDEIEFWKRSTIKTGDKVTVRINPLRDGQPGEWYLGITLPDGKVLGGEPPQR
jgi:hypothetical protein